MTLLKVGIVASVLFFFVATLYLLWQNRASQEMMMKVLSMFAAGTIATLITVVFSFKSETRQAAFTTTYIFSKTTKYPFAPNKYPYVTGFTEPSATVPVPFLIQELTKRRPDVISKNDLNASEDLYFDIVTAKVFEDVLSLFPGAWDVDIASRKLYWGQGRTIRPPARTGGQNAGSKDIVLGREYFTSLLETEDVFLIEPLYPKDMHLPPGTIATKDKTPDTRWVEFHTPFVNMRIEITKAGITQGIGPLQPILDYSLDEANEYWTCTYTISLSAKFNAFKGGHPQMAAFKKWAGAIFDELQNDFDSSRRWQELKENHLLIRAERTPDKAL